MGLWRQSVGKYMAMEPKSGKIWSFGGKIEEIMGLWRLSPGKYGAIEAK